MNEIESIIHKALKGDQKISPERRIVAAFQEEGYTIVKFPPRSLGPIDPNARGHRPNYATAKACDVCEGEPIEYAWLNQKSCVCQGETDA